MGVHTLNPLTQITKSLMIFSLHSDQHDDGFDSTIQGHHWTSTIPQIHIKLCHETNYNCVGITISCCCRERTRRCYWWYVRFTHNCLPSPYSNFTLNFALNYSVTMKCDDMRLKNEWILNGLFIRKSTFLPGSIKRLSRETPDNF